MWSTWMLNWRRRNPCRDARARAVLIAENTSPRRSDGRSRHARMVTCAGQRPSCATRRRCGTDRRPARRLAAGPGAAAAPRRCGKLQLTRGLSSLRNIGRWARASGVTSAPAPPARRPRLVEIASHSGHRRGTRNGVPRRTLTWKRENPSRTRPKPSS